MSCSFMSRQVAERFFVIALSWRLEARTYQCTYLDIRHIRAVVVGLRNPMNSKTGEWTACVRYAS